jgi:hypothetical protein
MDESILQSKPSKSLAKSRPEQSRWGTENPQGPSFKIWVVFFFLLGTTLFTTYLAAKYEK